MKSNDVKGLILIISGVIIAFFPNIISKLFYLIGVIIILFFAVKIIKAIISADCNPLSITLDVFGIIAGGIITSLPSFVQIMIPLTVGFILTANGIDFIVKALSSPYKRIINAVVAVILTGLGVTLMFNLVKAGGAIRITAGIIMIVAGAYDFFMSRHSYESGGIIDVDSYTVKDDTKFLK